MDVYETFGSVILLWTHCGILDLKNAKKISGFYPSVNVLTTRSTLFMIYEFILLYARVTKTVMFEKD